jgi:hypothetical protein
MVLHTVIQRLDPEPVANKHKPPPVLIPECNGKHAVEVINEVQSVCLVGMCDGFGVGLRVEMMPLRFKVSAQHGVIIDFSIKDDLDGLVFIVHGLPTGFQVDNAEPAHTDPDITLNVKALIIRAAMHQCTHHVFEHVLINGFPVKMIYSGNATHGFCSGDLRLDTALDFDYVRRLVFTIFAHTFCWA